MLFLGFCVLVAPRDVPVPKGALVAKRMNNRRRPNETRLPRAQVPVALVDHPEVERLLGFGIL